MEEPLTPHPRDTHERLRRIKFPISDAFEMTKCQLTQALGWTVCKQPQARIDESAPAEVSVLALDKY